eukprot:TRINITY_DN6091_c0_g1_i6.p1 TRINITY_DN6091_c0_g1~~TRINITY_DN6091_c0_g1_i6.p1  ORF type:complete len:223 (-),score=35.88 TRINITY_DN6091_c0_g1_i6:358-1026(-)
MAGVDMPIKTPREINYFLGEHRGKSFIYEHCVWPHYRQTWKNYTWAELNQQVVQVTDIKRIQPPKLKLRWGQHYVILHRDVVEWMFQQGKIMHLLSWLQNTKSPDEMFYATMLYNSPYNTPERLFTHNNFKYATWENCCSGSPLSAGHPCILGLCDIYKLKDLNHLWATKMDSDFDSLLVPTLKKLLDARSLGETTTRQVKRIPLVPGQILVPEYIHFEGGQ